MERTTSLPGIEPGERQQAPMHAIPAAARRRIAIEVRDLHKTFRIPTERVDTLKERVARPWRGSGHRILEALDGVTFDVEQGEFFGVVGRNGSGKSTLLKLLASIYRADSGSIRVAGRLAPLIELGVGFNLELSARDNVVLNGVMMGLTPREARHRFDEIIEFAELEEFTELKLKNYSSGMLVRLGFSLMTQVDADVLLVDEVLAVGDASFQQKCFDAFGRMHQEGRTIVLVTHDMGSVESHCDRALLLESGRVEHAGEPSEVARGYLRLNFEHRRQGRMPIHTGYSRDHPHVVDFEGTWVQNADDVPLRSLARGEPLIIRTTIKARRRIEQPIFAFHIINSDGLLVHVTEPIGLADTDVIEPGEVAQVMATLDNPLASGHYYIHVVVGRNPAEPEQITYQLNAADFVVYGADGRGGVLSLGGESIAQLNRSVQSAADTERAE